MTATASFLLAQTEMVEDSLGRAWVSSRCTRAGSMAEIAGTDGFATDAKLAKWAGAAPLDASSGKQQHHRLNRGGNRQANRALHTIIITQLSQNGEAVAYLQKRHHKTKKFAIRALKRHLARRIWKILHNHQPATTT